MKTIQGYIITRSKCAFVSDATSSDVADMIKWVAKESPGKVILVSACDCGCFGTGEEYARKSKIYDAAIRSAGAVRANFDWGSESFRGCETAIILDHEAFLVNDRFAKKE